MTYFCRNITTNAWGWKTQIFKERFDILGDMLIHSLADS